VKPGMGKAVGTAMGNAGKKGMKAGVKAGTKATKVIMDKSPDFESFSKWLIRIVSTLPKYLQLYVRLLVDNRVSHKAKALLATAIGLLGFSIATPGPLMFMQQTLAIIFGPFAFLPTVIIMMITLDICYQVLAADILEEHGKKVFGPDNSLQQDIARLRDLLGGLFEKLKSGFIKKTDSHVTKLEEQGMIEDGVMSEDAIQKAVDQAVALQASPELQERMASEIGKLGQSTGTSQQALDQICDSKLLEA
jgi:hypothetical protein